MQRAKTTLRVIAALSIVLLTVGIGGISLTLWKGDAAPDTTPTAGLSQKDIDTLQEYVRSHSAIIQAMPNHAQSQEVYNNVLRFWKQNNRGVDAKAIQHVVRAFHNSPLGVYALEEYLATASQGKETLDFSQRLIRAYPDSPTACRALDFLLEKDAANFTLHCDSAIRLGSHKRVGIFALMRLGDYFSSAGDHEKAIEHWLRSWILAPERGKQLFNQLYTVWLEEGEWAAPVLLTGDYLCDPVLNSIKERILQRLVARHEEKAPKDIWRDFDALGRVLHESKFGDISEALRRVVETLRAGCLLDPDRADFGVALFLVGGNNDALFPRGTAALVKARSSFDRYRHEGLLIAVEAFPSLPPELRAYYRLRIAERSLQDLKVAEALQCLNNSWQEDAQAPVWAARLLQAYGDILCFEASRPAKAAEVFAQNADRFADARVALLSQSAALYLQARLPDKAFEQANRLLDLVPAGQDRAFAEFLSGVCYLMMGSTDEAEYILEQAKNRGVASIAAESEKLLALSAASKHDIAEAQEQLNHLEIYYPESKAAQRAARYNKQLERISQP